MTYNSVSNGWEQVCTIIKLLSDCISFHTNTLLKVDLTTTKDYNNLYKLNENTYELENVILTNQLVIYHHILGLHYMIVK